MKNDALAYVLTIVILAIAVGIMLLIVKAIRSIEPYEDEQAYFDTLRERRQRRRRARKSLAETSREMKR